jgi:Family of unknown function (DUF6585)
MLGPELETYRGNMIVMTVVAILALGPAALVYLAFTTIPDNGFRIFALALLAIPVFFILWLRSLRVSLHNDGISYRSLFSEKEMRWDAVERFGYEAIKRSINFIPVGTYYLFRLRDAEGKKLRIGNRVERTAQLGQKLIDRTYPELYCKAVERYHNGEELDFDAIKVSKTGGIKIKKLFDYKDLPWDQVSSYAIQQGNFYIWRAGEKRTSGWGLHHVPNAFVLLGLLNSLFKPSAG